MSRYIVNPVGRPREHNEETRSALRAAAERIVAAEGYGALSVRAVADEAGTTTRAVYSVFGSKEGLVDALAQTAFEFLFDTIERMPETDDAVADLVAVGLQAFRPLAIEHPALYRIAFQRVIPHLRAGPELTAARQRAFAQLRRRIERVNEAGRLGAISIDDATVAFEAVMEGLANAELRGATLPILPAGDEERAWRTALQTVVRGFAAPPNLFARQARAEHGGSARERIRHDR
jgi:AcrR family transcriptional regulator